MKITKINESFHKLQGTKSELLEVHNFLKVQRDGAYFEPQVKAGFKSPYDYLCSVQGDDLLIPSGLLSFLSNWEIYPEPKFVEYQTDELVQYYQSLTLPFKPYKHQLKPFLEMPDKQIIQVPTGGGKSLIIAMFLDFFKKKGKKCLLIIPNINLLTQMEGDFNDYGLVGDVHLIGGGNTDKHLHKEVTISTWQSLMNMDRDLLKEVDVVIGDEIHKGKAEQYQSLLNGCVNAKYKLGFTGTLPESELDRMKLFGVFGEAKSYIRMQGLVELGLATPIKINAIQINYSKNDRNLYRECKGYQKQLSFIKDHEKRNDFIANLTCKVKNSGVTLVLGQHTNHIKGMYIQIMNKLYPDVEIENKNITGKKSFEFQEKYNVYFLNGEDDAQTREKTRNILEEHPNAIIISNYQLLSTGVNIKRLQNLIFAAPMKSYTTITQSIGRLARLHPDKTEANIYDIVDFFGRKSDVFYKQFVQRKEKSYDFDGFPIQGALIEF
jgi:superfamily II DNA or RNA helicase